MFEAVVVGEGLSLRPSVDDDRVSGLFVEELKILARGGERFVVSFANTEVQASLLGLERGNRVMLTGHSKEGYRPPVIEIDRVDDVV